MGVVLLVGVDVMLVGVDAMLVGVVGVDNNVLLETGVMSLTESKLGEFCLFKYLGGWALLKLGLFPVPGLGRDNLDSEGREEGVSIWSYSLSRCRDPQGTPARLRLFLGCTKGLTKPLKQGDKVVSKSVLKLVEEVAGKPVSMTTGMEDMLSLGVILFFTSNKLDSDLSSSFFRDLGVVN